MNNGVFRKTFPEFSDTARYPDSQLLFYSTFAEAMVNENRWCDQKPYGVMLYVAHEIALAFRNSQTANVGGIPGQSFGPVNSKTVGQATIAYDTQQGAEKDAGWWNLTIYGKQFYRLTQIFGAGVFVV